MTPANLSFRFPALACAIAGFLIYCYPSAVCGSEPAEGIAHPMQPEPENREQVKVLPQDSPLAGMVRQAFINSQAIPKVVDGHVDGPSVRTNELLRFVVDDYKRRIGEHPEGPEWQTLTYSVVAYDRAVHMNVASGTGVVFVKGCKSAGYSMAVLDYPDSVKHALVQAVLMNKDGGFYFAFWDLEWTPTGWHSRMSGTPTVATDVRIPSLVK